MNHERGQTQRNLSVRTFLLFWAFCVTRTVSVTAVGVDNEGEGAAKVAVAWPGIVGTRQGHGLQLPSKFEGLVDCPIGVPDSVLNQCIQLAFEELWPFLAKGVPEIGLPSADPLFFRRLPPCPASAPGCSDSGPTPTPTPLFAFHNLTLVGLSNFTKLRVSLDTRAKSMRREYSHPLLSISGGYALAPFRRHPWLSGRLLIRILNLSYNSTLFTRLEHVDDPGRTRIHVVRVDFQAEFDDLELELPGFSDSSRMGAWVTKNVLGRLLKYGLHRYFNTAYAQHQVSIWEDPLVSPVNALAYFFLPYFAQHGS